MLDAVVPAALEDVGEADDIAVDVGVRVDQRVAHAGLRGQVHDAVELLLREQRRDALAVGHVHLHEAEVRVRRQARQPILLESRVVVVVEVVQAHDLVPARQQELRDVHADEAGRAGDEDFHVVGVVALGRAGA